MIQSKKIRLGTRGSPLALIQTEMVRAALKRVAPDLEAEVVIIKTSGDWDPSHGETRLSEAKGGKGQFAKEIEEALLKGEIDAGIHSMKDMESHLPQGLVISQMLAREDARDCFILNDLANSVQNIESLPQGFVVGTSSVRRAAFLKARRPDIKIVPLRGNVGTRIEKLRRGEQGMQGIIMAYAGLKRLGLGHEASFLVPLEEMLPCAGQGAVGIETRVDSQYSQNGLSVFGQIISLETVLCVSAERAALQVLDGSCHTPIGGYATYRDGEIHLKVMVTSLDGSQSFFEEARGKVGNAQEAEAIGKQLGKKLKARLPAGFLD